MEWHGNNVGRDRVDADCQNTGTLAKVYASTAANAGGLENVSVGELNAASAGQSAGRGRVRGYYVDLE